MVAFNLGTSFGAKVDKNGYRELSSTEITKGLVVLPFGQLRDSLAFYNDISHSRLHHQIHLEVSFERLTIKLRMELKLFVHVQSLLDKLLSECFLVDVLRKSGAELFVHFEDTSHDIVTCLHQFTLLWLLHTLHPLRLLRAYLLLRRSSYLIYDKIFPTTHLPSSDSSSPTTHVSPHPSS